MIKNYVSYLFFTTLKRPFFYILPSLFIVLSSLISIPQIWNFNKSNGQAGFFSSINFFFSWFIFVMLALFLTMIIIHAFKRQEESGAELLIAAKQITRLRIILGKLIYILICTVIFISIATSWLFVLSIFDKNASISDTVRIIFSVFLGSIIISLLFGSIILLMASFMEKIGTIVVSILLSIFIFIFHAATIPTTNAINPINDNVGAPQFKSDGTYSIKRLYGKPPKNSYELTYDAIKANNRSSYNYLRFIDFWGQWGNYFNILKPPATSKNNSGESSGFFSATRVNFRSINENDLNNGFIRINIDDDSTAYQQNDISNIGDLAKNDVLKQSNIDKYLDDTLQANKSNPDLNIIDLDDVNTTLRRIITYVKENYLKSISDDEISKMDNVLFWKLSNSLFNNHKDIKFSSTSVIKTFDDDRPYGDNVYSRDYVLSSEKGYIVVTSFSPFINSTVVVTTWTIIAIGLSAAVVWIYLRRDFK